MDGGETPKQTETPKSTGKWVLVNTETNKSEEDEELYTMNGGNGSYEVLCDFTSQDQGTGNATATISEPPSEIKAGDEISFQISGNCSSNFTFVWDCAAYLGFDQKCFTIEGWESGYETTYRVEFGTGGDSESANSETVVLKTAREGKSGETTVIKIGLYASAGISTAYTYEWQG